MDTGKDPIIDLKIPPVLAEKMDRSLITPEDARKVVAWCESTGIKLRDNNTGEYAGHLRCGALTYWVRYRVDGEAYTLCNIYTHRIRLAEDTV